MRLRVNLYGCYTVLDAFWVAYDDDTGGLDIFTVDDDVVFVEMDVEDWYGISFDLMRYGFYDLISYDAVLEEEG